MLTAAAVMPPGPPRPSPRPPAPRFGGIPAGRAPQRTTQASRRAPAAAFDEDAFRTWLLVRGRRTPVRPITAQRMLERLAYATWHGFDLAAFHQAATRGDAAWAQLVGDAFLARRLADGTSAHAYNNDVKWLNALAAYEELERTRWSFRRPPPPPEKALDDDQVLHLLQLWEGRRSRTALLRRALLQLESVTGLRPSELAALDLDDLDPVRSKLHVRHPAKDGRRRWIPVPRWVWSPRRAFGAYLARHRSDPFDPRALWTSNRPGGPRRGWHRLTANYVRTLFWDAGQALGFAVNCTVLRHTVATRLRRLGRDIHFISKFLGHRSVASTQIYAELSEAELEREYHRRPLPDPFQRRRDR